MERIVLQQLLPDVFAGKEKSNSDLWNTSLELQKGKSYLIEAASGTGKTSLCSYIYGYRSDYSGMIRFDNDDIRDFSAKQWSVLRRNSLSMLFQELRLFPELTALENIQLKNTLTHDFRTKEWISNTFVQLGIIDKIGIPLAKLSFGQQQRVALIRALCQPFDFLFLDEPVSHLDEANSRIISQFIEKEVIKKGLGLIVTSIGKHPDLSYDKILQL